VGSIPDLADCRPGLRATGFAMIVAVAPVAEQSKGGIFIPDAVREKDKLTGVQGRIISKSPACFDHGQFGDAVPQVGDVVQFAKLAGVMTTGADGREYRIIQDKDVMAIVEEAA
jgi:co-chaperonin GroES (HSP10)